MTAVLRVLLVPLAMLALGLALLGVTLLGVPYPYDAGVTSSGYFFLFLAGGLVVLTIRMFRGGPAAWVGTLLVAGSVLLVPAAFWLSDLLDGLGQVESRYAVEMTATATAPAPIFPLADAGTFLVLTGAAGAVPLLLLPGTRRDLRARRVDAGPGSGAGAGPGSGL
ncbi:hypothetical protein JIG36_22675 [Actinoplanes sp. LDG1-06]|uniref:NADH dehydrogenase subunit 6 n=1 Tax=Paractinoplanes ovalisporus TaxID=2810368 RepID=A0ABS2AEW3_9ACTN|nr:hypothetical protein [Actinoplanes ovalisporus]MBM2618370.1 hypothetical protein [Actinoplanes ovalisporus]